MSKLETILSETEKKTSIILEIDKSQDLSLKKRELFEFIKDFKFRNMVNRNKRLTRIILEEGFVIKLETYDNGTPYVIVFDETDPMVSTLPRYLKIASELLNVSFKEINI